MEQGAFQKEQLEEIVDDILKQGEESLSEEKMEIACQLLWEALESCQGEIFQTAKGLTFAYSIKGNEMFVDRKEKSLTRATVQFAFHTALKLQKRGEPISGPKKLKTFGASYLFPVFIKLGVIRQ